MSYDKVDRIRLGVAAASVVGLCWYGAISGQQLPVRYNGDSVGREAGESLEDYRARCGLLRIDAPAFALVTFNQSLPAAEAAAILAPATRVNAIIPPGHAPIAVPEPLPGVGREAVFAGAAETLIGVVVYAELAQRERISEHPNVLCVEALPADAAWGDFGIRPVFYDEQPHH